MRLGSLSSWTGSQTLGEMGTGWIRWDSLLPKQLLHSTVFREVALSPRITPSARQGGSEGGEGKKLFAWSQTVGLRGQKLCQCRA